MNDLQPNAPLQLGQAIKLPHQAFLDAGRDAKNKILALEYFIQTHRGALPPNVANPPSITEQFSDPANWSHIDKNGYRFDLDPMERTRRVTGEITDNVSQGRSRSAQADRLPSDDGGHYVARRFNGPTDAFNHFAQDGNFNRGAYRVLEDKWAKARKSGEKVDIKITPSFEGLSLRPSAIEVRYAINDRWLRENFVNRR